MFFNKRQRASKKYVFSISPKKSFSTNDKKFKVVCFAFVKFLFCVLLVKAFYGKHKILFLTGRKQNTIVINIRNNIKWSGVWQYLKEINCVFRVLFVLFIVYVFLMLDFAIYKYYLFSHHKRILFVLKLHWKFIYRYHIMPKQA